MKDKIWIPNKEHEIMLKIQKEINLKEAVQTLIKALKEDPSYYISWQANIAISFYDAYNKNWEELNKYREGTPEKPDILTVANIAADNFLKLLIS